MPKKLEKALAKSAEAHGMRRNSEAWKRYVYGTMSRIKKAQIEHRYQEGGKK